MFSELKLAAIGASIMALVVGLPFIIGQIKSDARNAEIAVCNADKIAVELEATKKALGAEQMARARASERQTAQIAEASQAREAAEKQEREDAKLRSDAPDPHAIVFDIGDVWLAAKIKRRTQ